MEIIKDKTIGVMVVGIKSKKRQQPDNFNILKAKFVLYNAGFSNSKPLENGL